jgi:hypothetical protein
MGHDGSIERCRYLGTTDGCAIERRHIMKIKTIVIATALVLATTAISNASVGFKKAQTTQQAHNASAGSSVGFSVGFRKSK